MVFFVQISQREWKPCGSSGPVTESDFNNVSPAQWHIEAWGGDCIVRKEMGGFGAGLGSWLNGTLEGSSPLSQVWDVGSGELRAGRMS